MGHTVLLFPSFSAHSPFPPLLIVSLPTTALLIIMWMGCLNEQEQGFSFSFSIHFFKGLGALQGKSVLMSSIFISPENLQEKKRQLIVVHLLEHLCDCSFIWTQKSLDSEFVSSLDWSAVLAIWLTQNLPRNRLEQSLCILYILYLFFMLDRFIDVMAIQCVINLGSLHIGRAKICCSFLIFEFCHITADSTCKPYPNYISLCFSLPVTWPRKITDILLPRLKGLTWA